MIDQAPLPPAIVEFAEKHNCINVVRDKYFPVYKDAKVFYAHPADDEIKHDYFLLLEEDNVRFATPEEYEELTEIYL